MLNKWRAGAHTDITINFAHPDDMPVLRPGDTLEGDIQIETEKEINCRQVQVQVGWHTTGKGDINRGPADEITEPIGTLIPGEVTVIPFRVKIPSAPWSYQGEILQIVWGVNVKIELSLAPDVTFHRPFIVEP